MHDLGTAYREVGFVAIGGHGIPQEVIDELYSEAEAFFGLPAETKAQHEHPEHNRQRGFVSFGTEHAKDSKAADLKEFWQVGQTNIPNGADLSHYPPNAFVEECEALEAQANNLYKNLENVGRDMLKFSFTPPAALPRRMVSWLLVPLCLSISGGPGGPGDTMTVVEPGSRRTALR